MLMKRIIIASYSLFFYGTLTPMSDTNHIICFFNKNAPEFSLDVNLLNIETGTYGNYSYTMTPGQKRIFDFKNIIVTKKPRLYMHNTEPQTIKFKINDTSSNTITFTMNDRYITVTNEENTILAQSIRTDQANSSRSCEEIQ